MNVQWLAIRSWHIVLTPTRVPNSYRLVCGRNASGTPEDDRPVGKTCETCLRIAGPK